jgi:hypothetical protein
LAAASAAEVVTLIRGVDGYPVIETIRMVNVSDLPSNKKPVKRFLDPVI